MKYEESSKNAEVDDRPVFVQVALGIRRSIQLSYRGNSRKTQRILTGYIAPCQAAAPTPGSVVARPHRTPHGHGLDRCRRGTDGLDLKAHAGFA